MTKYNIEPARGSRTLSELYNILDDLKLIKTPQRIRLKKIYDTSLLNMFPKALETLIYEYVLDVVIIDINHEYIDYTINIQNQYIDYDCISLSFNIVDCVSTDDRYYFSRVQLSNNVTSTPYIGYGMNQYLMCGNKYMELFGEKDYFGIIKYSPGHYQKLYASVFYSDNTLQCETLKITIVNHRLFKECLIIIKTILDAFNKKLKHNSFIIYVVWLNTTY